MKFLIYLLISLMGFTNVPSTSLSQNNTYIIDQQSSIIKEVVSPQLPSVEQDDEIVSGVTLSTKNQYWDKITLKGQTNVVYKEKCGAEALIIELPANFIKEDEIGFSSIRSSAIKDFDIKTIEGHQYLFIQYPRNYASRVYKDTLDDTTLHIDVAKSQNPYKYKVVIDPGHGGYDPGATKDGVDEKNVVLDISLRMEHRLKDMGIDVVYTRKNDVFVDLPDRSFLSNRVQPDAFVSVHDNSNEDTSPNGIATYMYSPNGYQTSQRLKLATSIQSELMKEFPTWTDLGILQDNFSVLRRTKQPSVLVEFGFISNAKDREMLSNPQIRDKAAVAISNGIEKYLITK
jgi:N-acetylmuramoyl-L-alanine amidase